MKLSFKEARRILWSAADADLVAPWFLARAALVWDAFLYREYANDRLRARRHTNTPWEV
jgi:hypothetical protein